MIDEVLNAPRGRRALTTRRACLWILPTVFAAGCSERAEVKISNGTGGDVALRIRKEMRNGREQGETWARLGSGRSITIDDWRLLEGGLRVRHPGCERVYALSGDDVRRAHRDGRRMYPVEVRITDARILELLTGRDPAAQAHPPSEFGFPRAPLRSNCA